MNLDLRPVEMRYKVLYKRLILAHCILYLLLTKQSLLLPKSDCFFLHPSIASRERDNDLNNNLKKNYTVLLE